MTKLHYSPGLGRLAKCTAKNCPYGHFDSELMKPMAPINLVGAPKILKSSYQALEVRPDAMAPALNQLRSAMSPDLFSHVVKRKAERDEEESYHLTILDPKEFRKLKNEGRLDELQREKPFHFELLGVGTAANDRSQTWFAVARSVAIDHYRYKLGLPRKDLHVTLGFTESDVHGVRKDESTLL